MQLIIHPLVALLLCSHLLVQMASAPNLGCNQRGLSRNELLAQHEPRAKCKKFRLWLLRLMTCMAPGPGPGLGVDAASGGGSAAAVVLLWGRIHTTQRCPISVPPSQGSSAGSATSTAALTAMEQEKPRENKKYLCDPFFIPSQSNTGLQVRLPSRMLGAKEKQLGGGHNASTPCWVSSTLPPPGSAQPLPSYYRAIPGHAKHLSPVLLPPSQSHHTSCPSFRASKPQYPTWLCHQALQLG